MTKNAILIHPAYFTSLASFLLLRLFHLLLSPFYLLDQSVSKALYGCSQRRDERIASKSIVRVKRIKSPVNENSDIGQTVSRRSGPEKGKYNFEFLR